MARLASLCSVGVLVAGTLTAITIIGVGSSAAGSATACQPRVIDLGDPFGGGFSFADGINTDGVIAGSAFLPDGSGRAVVWRGGHVSDLGVIGKYDESFAHDISVDGTVVGELNRRHRKSAPFIYAHGRMRRLPGLGGDFGYAYAINDNDVVVGAASDPSGNPHAVIWTNNGRTVHDLGIASGDVASFGSGINNSNTVAGDTDDAAGTERPAVFGDAVTVLATKNAMAGAAEDVNDRGRIVGITQLPDTAQHAAYWASRGSLGRDLGVLPGGSDAALVDIDNAGEAVGGGDAGRHPNTRHAVFWPGHGPLEVLRPLSGHLVRDFAIARNLDEHGDAVGGSATDDGQIHGTVWQCAAAQAVLPSNFDQSVPVRAVQLPAPVARR